MRNMKNVFVAGAASVLLASTAHAQDLTLGVDPTGTNVGNDAVGATPQVILSTDAPAAGQSGDLVITISPAVDNFGLAAAVIVDPVPAEITVTLSNLEIESIIVPGNLNGDEDGGGGCDVLSTEVSNLTTAAVFTVDDIGDCLTTDVIAITLPVVADEDALEAGSTANFTVGITDISTPAQTIAATQAFDADLVEDGIQPLVDFADSAELEVVAADDSPTLALGLTPPFSAFIDPNGPGTPPSPTSAPVGTVEVTDNGTFTDITAQTSADVGVDRDLTVTLGASADGIEAITLGGPLGTGIEFEQDEDNPLVFTLEATVGDLPDATATGIYVNLNDGSEADESDAPATVLPQSVTAEISLTTSTPPGTLTETGALAPIETAADVEGPFVFTTLEVSPGTSNNQFRITGLEPDTSVTVTVTNLNQEAGDADGGTSFSLVLPASFVAAGVNPAEGPGELLITSGGIGTLASNAGLIDFTVGPTVRGDITFSFEQDGVDVQRFVISGTGALTDFGGDF